MMKSEKFSGFVLAGGRSSRMKTDKAFLEIGGQTFIKRAVETLKSVCGNPVRIVLNPSQKDFINKNLIEAEYIFDIFENRGALGGIHTALKNCQSKFAVILAVDLPFVDSSVIKMLTETATKAKDFSVVVPRQTDGRLQPLCAVYRVADCLPEIEKVLLKNESLSVRKFLDNLSVRVIKEEFFGENRNLFANINTPIEYENLTGGV